MGEVYRARDTKLKRDAAIKVLLPAVANDPERLARFEREAHVLASLNHPNIAQIYGFEDAGEVHGLAMELVEGPTLADRIAAGALSWNEAHPIVRQIVDALEAAHEQGIIHRDLKPANIKVRPDGAVKVLDFGLAKALDPAPASPPVSAMNSPTLTAATQLGVILGTAAYMSPEQAKGRPADRRSDVWGLGCVMYEMLTGRRAFDGDDVSEVLASVLKSDPDWNAFPSDVPPHVRALVQRCLTKDRRARVPDASVIRFLIDEPGTHTWRPDTAVAARRATWPWLAAIGAAIALTAAVTAVLIRPARPSPPAPLTRFTIVVPPEQAQLRGITISPDGRTIVYATNRRLYLRTISDVALRVVDGTEDAIGPFFSADGKWVGFFSGAEAKLEKVALTGGAPVTICDMAGALRGTFWTGDNQILLASDGIKRVPANGGVLETLIAPKPGEVMQGPQLLLDGDHIVFAIGTDVGLNWDAARIVVQSLKTGERRTLVEGGSDPRVVPGHLLYALGSTMLAVPFDVARLEVTGAPVPVLTEVSRAAGRGLAGLGISETGTLVQIVGSNEPFPRSRLALVDFDGRRTLVPGADGRLGQPRISPDGQRAAVLNRDERGNAFVWIIDLKGSSSMRRLTFAPVTAILWSRDGQRIIFGSVRDAGTALYWQPADGSGSEERLTEPASNDTYFPNSMSPDGNTLAFYTGRNGGDVWKIALTGDRTLKPLISLPASHQDLASFSADGKWIAYRSDESGRYEIFVQPYPPTGAKYQITTTGGHSPLWAPDGKRLFYIDNQSGLGHVAVVDVSLQPGFAASNPVALPIEAMFPETIRPYDIMPDGKRFLVAVPEADAKDQTGTLRVTMNWFDELSSRVASGR